MPGSLMGQFDITQFAMFAFVAFFFLLVLYLQRESRREGYPLEGDTDGKLETHSTTVPTPKTFKLLHGGETQAPNDKRDSDWLDLKLKRTAVWPGAPYEPTGDPLADGVGPAAYANRADVPDKTFHGDNKLQPMSKITAFDMAPGDKTLIGFEVVGADGAIAGVVCDLWVDVGEQLIRYVEIELVEPKGEKVLAPMTLLRIQRGRGRVLIQSITAGQFSKVPRTKKPDEVTLLEEDKISAYYCGGMLYATPMRVEPLA